MNTGVLDGIGHNVPQEAPEQFAAAIADVSWMGVGAEPGVQVV